MRFIILDAVKLEVREEVMEKPEPDFLRYAYKTIGCELVEHVIFMQPHQNNAGVGLDGWVDEEGRLKNPRRFTEFLGHEYAGSVILTGFDSEGNTIGLPDSIKVEEVNLAVVFHVYPDAE